MTKTYVNNSRKIETLQAEYDDLLNLMSKAESVEDVLTIKDRLYNIQYELDSLQQSNNNIDYDANYSILTVYIEKSSSLSYKLPFSKQLKEAFSDSIEIIKDFILFLVTIWWIILIILLIIFRKKIFKKLKNNKDFNLSKDIVVPENLEEMTPNVEENSEEENIVEESLEENNLEQEENSEE